MEEKKIKKWLGKIPTKCDLCQAEFAEFFVDGRTTRGMWGNMCIGCHMLYGCGLGTGNGQKYSIKTGEKVEG